MSWVFFLEIAEASAEPSKRYYKVIAGVLQTLKGNTITVGGLYDR